MEKTHFKKRYTKFKVKGLQRKGFVGFQSDALWLAEDHLLHILRRGLIFDYSETYRRYYFKDIKSFEMYPTYHYLFQLFIWIGISLFFALLLILYLSTSSVDVMAWILIVSSLIVFLRTGWIATRGKSCRFFLSTAEFRVEIPALRRIIGAQNAQALLAPLIEAAQGKVSAEEIQSYLLRTGTPPPTPPVVRKPEPPAPY